MAALVEITNLHVGYARQPVLQNINFCIQANEVAVIAGRSGCGKSTLLKTMIGLLRPLGGAIAFWGEEINAFSETQWRAFYQKIGVLYQNGALLNSLSVYDNIALPLGIHFPHLNETIQRKMVFARLEQVNLAQSAKRLPAELSGGMRKRVALARALILDPHIIFCDEPAAGLDPISAIELDALILRLRALLGVTFVVVTHEIASIRRIADRLLVLEKGRLEYDGNMAGVAAQRSAFLDQFFVKDG